MKDVQKLTGYIAALRRFIPQASKRCIPFFQVIKEASKMTPFRWNEECKQSFEALKDFLVTPHVLTRATPQETLKVYLSASDSAVAAVLIRTVEGRESPVYYVSHSLKDAETRYPQVEKLVFSLVIASRKLRHYFQGREIHVVTNQPLKRILHKPDMSGRLAAWTIELSQFSISFIPRTTIKAQVLSDFVAECQFSNPCPLMSVEPTRHWLLFADGSSTSTSDGAGIILVSPEGFKIQQALKFTFPVTNNVAEYEAMIAGVRLAVELEVKFIDIFVDSQLVAKQINGEFKTHNDRMMAYLQLSKDLLQKIPSWKITHVAREENQWADALSKLASSILPSTSDPVYVEEKYRPSIEANHVNEIHESVDWRSPIPDYIMKEKIQRTKMKLGPSLSKQEIIVR